MSEATSVGQIGLDLVVNKKDFNKQMSGIQNLATKVSKKLAAAFAVKKLVDFSAKCIELGSDLSEVQNVVDVTFPAMSKQVDKFAQNASTAFGLSETMAKKYTGTFGAMAKAFGFGEQQAYDMSTTLTGLAGDVASFYNITQDEAYTKLKSVFTGETESLKDLGVVMTQTALDAYAMANGYGKTTAAMSEAEKVALRYSFVQSKLATASGDFMRTSDGWANQVRILKLQTESFMAAIGQGLINVLTPAIKVINTLMGKLVQLANVFKAFTDKFAGKKGNDVATGMAAAEVASAGISDNINAAGKAAKKLGGLLPTDELDLLSQKTDSSSASGGSSGIDIAGLQTSTQEVEASVDKISKKLSDAFKIPGVKNFADQFNNGLKKIDFGNLKDNFSRIMAQMDPLAKTTVRNIETIMDPLGGYLGSPEQRADLDSDRNGLNKLYREVADHYTTKIEFNTIPMESAEMTDFLQALETAYINVKERKALVTYFDVNTGEYKTGEMYVPNYTVETKSWNGMELEYKPLRVAFIEY